MQALLLDENFPRSVGIGLAAAGHEVQNVADCAAGTADRGVLQLARDHGLRLLTLDADFGDLVFHQGVVPPPAILYFRLHPIDVDQLLELALRGLRETPDGYFAVIARDGTRLRAFP